MGCYDVLRAKIKCPYCGEDTNLEEQVKWADRSCGAFEIGDILHGAVDGDYFYGSSARNTLWNNCEVCNKEIIYGVIIEEGKFKEILFG